MNNLRAEFSKLIQSMKSKECDIQDRDSEISNLRLDNEKYKALLDEKDTHLNRLG